MKAIIAVPVALVVLYRAWSRQTLTHLGIFTAALTAVAHAVHPWSLPFVLLFVFFIAGTRVTKVKHHVKAQLTMKSTGSSGGEGARTHIQVLANSGVASILSILHAYQLNQRDKRLVPASGSEGCYPWGGDLLVVGIVANYVAVAADTFSSELGILSKSRPRLITSWNLRQVPPGTNGGVTVWGLVAGLLGSLLIAAVSTVLIPFCPIGSSVSGGGWSLGQRLLFTFAMTIWGGLGSVLDSVLGGFLQQSVVDTRTGRIVEGEGGRKVLISNAGPNSMHFKKEAQIKEQVFAEEGEDEVEGELQANQLNDTKKTIKDDRYDAKKKYRKSSFGDEKPSRVIESGSLGLLDNNEVNFLMALTMSLGAMGVAGWVWRVPLQSIIAF